MIVEYTFDGDPTEHGVYAVRVPMGVLYEDKFLMWHEGRWWYLRSSEAYRGKVCGWLGPLRRKVPE